MAGKGITFAELDGSSLRIGIVTARWNSELSHSLRDAAIQGLKECAVIGENIVSIDVPGSYELVAGAKYLIDEKQVDAVICIGVLVKGQTDHYEYIAQAVTQGIAHLNAAGTVPVMFGVLTCRNEEDARDRATGEGNHGAAWGKSAVEMALLRNA